MNVYIGYVVSPPPIPQMKQPWLCFDEVDTHLSQVIFILLCMKQNPEV